MGFMRVSRIPSGHSSLLVLSALLCAATSTLQVGCGGNVGGTGGDGGGGGDVCAAFATDPPTASVTVRVLNNTENDLYIGPETAGGCGHTEPFSLEDADGKALRWRLQNCDFTCEMLQTDACGCTTECELPAVWRIAPGGALSVDWNRVVFTTETMPDGCYDPGCGIGQECAVPREPSGELTFLASAWSEVGGDCGGECTCTPDAGGSCTIGMGEATVAGSVITTSTKVSEVASTVDIVFE